MFKLTDKKIYLILTILISSFAQLSYAQQADVGTIVNEALNVIEEGDDLISNDQNERVLVESLQANNLDVKQILDEIEAETGLTINTNENLTGRLSLYFEMVDVEDALRLICDAQELAYLPILEGERLVGYRIISREEYLKNKNETFDEKIKSEIVILNQANVIDIIKILAEMGTDNGKLIFDEQNKFLAIIEEKDKLAEMLLLINEVDISLTTEIFELQSELYGEVKMLIDGILTKNVGHLQFDERSNNVIVTDTIDKIQKIRSIIDEFNGKQRAIRVNIKILQITLSDEHLEGVDWEAIVSDYEKLVIVSSNDNIQLSLGTLNNEDFEVLLDALDTVGVVSEISDENVELFSGNGARVELNNEQLWKSISIDRLRRPLDQNDKIKLEYTSKFIDLENIELDILAEQMNAGETNNKSLEYIKRVNLLNGSTLIVGSYFIDKIVETYWKIPLLGDLPLLGVAFRSEGQVERKTEVMVFLTPQIIIKEE